MPDLALSARQTRLGRQGQESKNDRRRNCIRSLQRAGGHRHDALDCVGTLKHVPFDSPMGELLAEAEKGGA